MAVVQFMFLFGVQTVKVISCSCVELAFNEFMFLVGGQFIVFAGVQFRFLVGVQ